MSAYKQSSIIIVCHKFSKKNTFIKSMIMTIDDLVSLVILKLDCHGIKSSNLKLRTFLNDLLNFFPSVYPTVMLSASPSHLNITCLPVNSRFSYLSRNSLACFSTSLYCKSSIGWDLFIIIYSF